MAMLVCWSLTGCWHYGWLLLYLQDLVGVVGGPGRGGLAGGVAVQRGVLHPAVLVLVGLVHGHSALLAVNQTFI